MLQKTKYLLIGLVVGILITGLSAAAFADRPISVLIDNQELPNAQAMLVEGRVYVPLRVVSEALGLGVNWDAEQGAVKLSRQATAQSAPQSPPKPSSNSAIIDAKEVSKMAEIIKSTFNGLDAIVVNGQTYFNAGEYAEMLRGNEINPQNKVTYDQDSKVSTIHINGSLIKIPFTDENIQIHNGQTYFNTRFYSE